MKALKANAGPDSHNQLQKFLRHWDVFKPKLVFIRLYVFPVPFPFIKVLHVRKISKTALEVVTHTVTNATDIFSLAPKNSGLVATLVTRFLYDLDLN